MLKKYPKSARKYDIGNAKIKDGVGKFEGNKVVSITTEDGKGKEYSLRYIDEAIAACKKVDNYKTETRFPYWDKLRTKAVELGIEPELEKIK